MERRKKGRGLARLSPAQRAGVLAAGGRMVQKEGQAALEEPQGSPNPAGVPGAPLEPPGAAAGPVPGGEETDTETETALGSRRFLCGVVEGKSSRRGCPITLGEGSVWEDEVGGIWGVVGSPGIPVAGGRLVPAGAAVPCLLPRRSPLCKQSGARFLAGAPSAREGWGGGEEPRLPGGAAAPGARAGSCGLAGSAL